MEQILRDKRDQHGLDQRKIREIIQIIKPQKWKWTGYITKREDNRWYKRLEWCPMNNTFSWKRPDRR